MAVILNQLRNNEVFWISFLSWFVAQLIKVLIDLKKYKNFNKALLTSSGGMPSSHSSFVTAMSISIGLRQGFDSTIFALAATFSLVVMYDAAGVRRAAGKQAAVLNIIVKKMEKYGIELDENLKELLGHSPIEVACGAILGISIALIFYYIF